MHACTHTCIHACTETCMYTHSEGTELKCQVDYANTLTAGNRSEPMMFSFKNVALGAEWFDSHWVLDCIESQVTCNVTKKLWYFQHEDSNQHAAGKWFHLFHHRFVEQPSVCHSQNGSPSKMYALFCFVQLKIILVDSVSEFFPSKIS